MNDPILHSTLRERMFPLVWAMLYPVRLYLRSCPFQRGKGVLLRQLVMPLLPPREAEFELRVPGDAKVALRYRETLGLSSLLYGPFESSELQFAAQYLRPGEVVMDIGANVGLFSVVMAATIGPQGRVFAFEPVPDNVERLKRNLRRNGIENTRVLAVGLGEVDGEMALHMSKDTAYPSLHDVQNGFGDGTALPIQVRKLDDVWKELGMPDVSFVKMDVEGAEMDVLRGAARFIEATRAALLVEANSAQHLAELQSHLMRFGYRHIRPEGFVAHNHLFVCVPSSDGRAVLAE